MTRYSPRTRLAVPALLILLLAAGCGGKRRVWGTVTLDGAPVKSGVVTLIGPGDEQRAGNIGPDGRYVIEDPPAGRVQVTVANLVTRVPVAVYAPRLPKALAATLPPPPAQEASVPWKYARADNGLALEVTGGRQRFDIDLQP